MQSGEVVTFGHATLGWRESKRQIEALLLERATCGFWHATRRLEGEPVIAREIVGFAANEKRVARNRRAEQVPHLEVQRSTPNYTYKVRARGVAFDWCASPACAVIQRAGFVRGQYDKGSVSTHARSTFNSHNLKTRARLSTVLPPSFRTHKRGTHPATPKEPSSPPIHRCRAGGQRCSLV